MLLSRIWLLKKKNSLLFDNLKYKKIDFNFFPFRNFFYNNSVYDNFLTYFFKSFSFNGKNLFIFKLLNSFSQFLFLTISSGRVSANQDYFVLKNLTNNNSLYFNISSVFFYIFILFNYIFNFKIKSGKNNLLTKSINYIPFDKRFSSFFKFIKINMLGNYKKSYFISIYSTLQIVFSNPNNSLFVEKKKKLIQSFLY